MEQEHCKYYEWDRNDFVLPADYSLGEKSELADALSVFYAVGGYEFFHVAEVKYYASNWMAFVGKLYEEIVCGKYKVTDKHYIIPLEDEIKGELLKRGVPAIFVENI